MWNAEVTDDRDARETARVMFQVEIVKTHMIEVDKRTFDEMNVQNHRVSLDAAIIDDVFPLHDRPRGDDDVASVLYATANTVDPISVLILKEGSEGLVMLDGVHRLAAAYINDRPIRVQLYAVA